MSSRSPVRAAAAAAAVSRPTRLVFRPFDKQQHSSATAAAHNAENSHPPPKGSTPRSSQKSSQSQDYGIDFELDDDDAEAIEQVFAEYTKKLNEKEAEKLDPATDTILKQATTSSQPQLQLSQPKPEEDPAEQEEYHDSLALDALLDLEYDDGEVLADLELQKELPSSQQSTEKQPTASSSRQDTTTNREEWDSDEIDRQVLWEYEQWIKTTGYNELGNRKNEEVIDETPYAITRRNKEEASQKEYEEAVTQPALEIETDDKRSPLDRFRVRSGTKKLSVSDMLFGMWCEQQFHYTLLRGFKRRTAEMAAGTKIHRKMEEQVHVIVPVTVKTDHDKWGVRIWNMIQGLESLRTTGLTRELEVWGWMDGVFVNGVIDEVRFTRFDPEPDKSKEDHARETGDKEEEKEVPSIGNATEAIVAEAASSEAAIEEVPKTPKKRGRPRKNPTVESPKVETPKKQSTILDFMTPSPKKTRPKSKPAYVLDLKTRSSYSVPKPGSSQSLSVHLQLMLYRHLLNDMISARAASMVKKLCDQHGVPANEPFSDDLIAGLAATGGEAQDDQDALTALLENNSIKKLYSLYHKKLKETISTISPDLGVVYRWQQDGEFLEYVDYEADDEMLREHVESAISWWKGTRTTVGVEIEEAWKCRKCEFAEICTWRKGKLEQATRERRSKRILISQMA